ncbi:MAG: hypothetical protein ACXVBR_05650 [Flavisolibacter sp.]
MKPVLFAIVFMLAVGCGSNTMEKSTSRDSTDLTNHGSEDSLPGSPGPGTGTSTGEGSTTSGTSTGSSSSHTDSLNHRVPADSIHP